MKQSTSNYLKMIGASLTTAYKPENKAVWDNQPPLDCGTDLALLQTAYNATQEKSALATGAAGGAGDAKASAEATLEGTTFVISRALAVHFKKTDDLENRAKVDVTRSEIVKLRNQALVDKAADILSLATAAQTSPGAVDRGVTAERVTALTDALKAFRAVMNNPRGQIVDRGTLIKEVETDVAGLLVQVEDLDDLVIQFDATPAGQRFIAAWKRARIIVDSGGSHSAGEDTPPTTTPTRPPAQ